jgi:VCBS repeat-containing protein
LFMPVPSAGKTTAVDAAGNLDTTLSGTQTMWHIQNSTKIARSYTVTTYANHIPTVSNTTVITDFNTVGHVQLDAADLDSDTLTYSVTTAATHGVGSVNTTGYVTYTPTTGYSGSDSFVVTVSDGKGGTATSTISVTVYPFNIAPVVTSVIVKTVTAQITATDANGDTLTYTVTTQGAFGTASVNSSGLVTYTAGGSFAGKDTFVVTISDGHGGSKTVKFKIRGASSTGSSLSIGIGFGIGG